MSSPYDWNDLDRAVSALRKSKAALPELYRQLTRGELCALMPYHPEMEGMFKVQNGSPFNFVVMKDKDGEVVPIFSSEERAEEGMTAGKVPPNTYCTAAVNAREMLEILSAMKMRAVLNKSCSTGEVTLPVDMMRDLASGEALKPAESSGEAEEVTLHIVEPADYPTSLIQPLFETLRRDRSFRAGWLFRKTKPAPETGAHYMFMIVMKPRDETLEHDFQIVLANANKKPDEAVATFVDESDRANIDVLQATGPPFYRAPDFAG